ncbi:guanine nucleotide exchange factor [Syncephalastrum racemosum]|uniref:Guanine nucleotide exchange factor n=1 Tax=Syncephalastrum racemosum TaxID=13706 RepID=A0A1X2H5M7_SYNRA|nr:guanine nucleotide exchange factor [Syncephalastrum racemosum]
MLADDYRSLRDTDDTKLSDFFEGAIHAVSSITLDDKTQFIELLLQDIDQKSAPSQWDEVTTTRALELLKLLGRDPNGANSLFADKGISILMKVGGLVDRSGKDTPVSREALKCISNCILLKYSATSATLDKHNAVDACCHLLAKPDLSQESAFLTCRILFVMTVNNTEYVRNLMRFDIQPALLNVLSKNTENLVHETEPAPTPINSASVASEGLKLLFNLLMVCSRDNITHDGKEAIHYFGDCLKPVYDILFRVPLPEPMPLVPPFSHAINALMQYPYDISNAVFKGYKPITQLYNTLEEGRIMITTRLGDILERALAYLIPDGDPDASSSGQSVDAIISPVILVIRCIAAGEPNFIPPFKKRLLPNETDRIQPVNQGTSLSARLIRLMTSTLLPQTREAVSDLLFVLCNEDAAEFSHQVGYGNAIGFLVNRGISIEPPNGEGETPAEDVNPITGQYRANEVDQGPSLADMTMEEKEREAERLFVLFERLKKTGVIDVENPVATAMREGRFEELDDEDSDH